VGGWWLMAEGSRSRWMLALKSVDKQRGS